ncbi:hypothetical protein VP01_761g11 [Puccinia sorghi]|uniref:GAF domain-containing protein n=1 Tax=Puccinia sorghi TaxID=27349 RepID=A0A0L6UDY7_9BASI|nr:hypothetical protein VP01_761g11 [Puccinia sorghi]
MSTALINPTSGFLFPYSTLYNTSLRGQAGSYVSKSSRPSDYFWKKGTSISTSLMTAGCDDDIWLDSLTPAVSDSEDEMDSRHKKPHQNKSKKHIRLTRIRQIAFKAFTPKSDGSGHKKNIVTRTEILQREEKLVEFDKVAAGSLGPQQAQPKRATIFNSWKFKSSGTKTHVRKMVAVLKVRISAFSPPETHPKTWEEFHRYYANDQIDVFNPPLPPMQEADTPSAYEARFYSAPLPTNEKMRQLTLNRLGVFGSKPYDTSEAGVASWKGRVEAGEKLMAEGRAPLSLDCPWEPPSPSCSTDRGVEISEKSALASGMQSIESPPETLEQHPVLRRIVNECRTLFNTSLCLISVLDDTRQIFLAESGLAEVGLADLRDITKDISFCAHTILSGRKGFAVLDSHKDWRFEKGPLVQNYKLRFYAGVPLISPNMDKTQSSEENACPIGTLCIIDFAPREEFSTEDRKRLVYLSEYARREIEKWFARKMNHKMENLTACHETWAHGLKTIAKSPINMGEDNNVGESEVLGDDVGRQLAVATFPGRSSIFRRLSSHPSLSSLSASGPSGSLHRGGSTGQSLGRTGLGLFDQGVDNSLTPKMRKVFDLATTLIGQTLDLSMVFLTAVVPGDNAQGAAQTRILSGHNIPEPAPVIDGALCLRALRAPQGGLLYQNPTAQEAEEAGLQPQSTGAPHCESAMILTVGTSQASRHSGGFVISGYTADRLRVFGAEDVLFMTKFAHELARYTSKIQL